jgi:hypothetical protein
MEHVNFCGILLYIHLYTAMHGHPIFMVSFIYDPAAVHYTTEEYQNLTGNKTRNIDILKFKQLKSILLQGRPINVPDHHNYTVYSNEKLLGNSP